MHSEGKKEEKTLETVDGNYSNLQSKVIDFLRFPCTIGVLFIHSAGRMTLFCNTESNIFPIHYYCTNLFSRVLGDISVPIFFFISGFLFFLNINTFNIKTYKSKMLIRAKSLLVPYLFWNIIGILIWFAINNISELQYFAFQIKHNHTIFGIAYQFWFIKDLIVMVILSPIIYLIVKYTKFWGILALSFFYVTNIWFDTKHLSIVCVCLFATGAYFSIHKKNLIELFKKVKIFSLIIYPTIAILDLLTKNYAFNLYIHKLGIFLGIIFFFNITALLIERGKIKAIPFLSSASFFVYAIHDPFLMTCVIGIIHTIFKPETDLAISCWYFINVIITTAIAIGVYYLFQMKLPKFTAIVTGGRAK